MNIFSVRYKYCIYCSNILAIYLIFSVVKINTFKKSHNGRKIVGNKRGGNCIFAPRRKLFKLKHCVWKTFYPNLEGPAKHLYYCLFRHYSIFYKIYFSPMLVIYGRQRFRSVWYMHRNHNNSFAVHVTNQFKKILMCGPIKYFI